MTHCFFARPLPFLLTTASATTLGIAMAAASKPIATALSMKLALTVAGTASLATGLLAAGIVLAALGTLALVLGLLLCGRMRMREKHRYVEGRGTPMASHDDFPSRQPYKATAKSRYQ